MKKVIIVFSVFLLLTGCAGALKQTSGGKEDIGFILILGDRQKYGNVMLQIDDGAPTLAEVTPIGKVKKVDNSVRISTGKHDIKITFAGQVLVQQKIMVYAQETHKITIQ